MFTPICAYTRILYAHIRTLCAQLLHLSANYVLCAYIIRIYSCIVRRVFLINTHKIPELFEINFLSKYGQIPLSFQLRKSFVGRHLVEVVQDTHF